MPRKGHSEEQIAYALRQAETGKSVRELCREMAISAQAFYTWKRKYAGLGSNELRELRQLREENRKLKTLVADLTLNKHICVTVCASITWSTPPLKGMLPRSNGGKAANSRSSRRRRR